MNWELYSINFSLLIIMVVSIILFVGVWFGTHGSKHMHLTHVDKMAGDEGEDW